MQNSKIEWTVHTFNPWWGCLRVSPGCEHCYAETLARRYGFEVWGPARNSGRRMMSANYWRQPLRWNAAAAAAGERHRVFCASMADVFEDHPAVAEARAQLWTLIEQTPALDWLLLTKRPQNILSLIPATWQESPPANVWYGTSAEDQRRADERIPELLKVPAAVRFLSCEPLLGPVDLAAAGWDACSICGGAGEVAGNYFADDGVGQCEACRGTGDRRDGGIDWVIVGGESGAGARPMHPAWARSLRDQCTAAGVAFFFKQWGNWRPVDTGTQAGREALVDTTPTSRVILHQNGTAFYAPSLQQASKALGAEQLLVNVGKGAAGRELDGRTWDELPATPAEVTR